MDIGVALQKKKKGVQFLARSIVEGKYLFKIESLPFLLLIFVRVSNL